MTDSEEDLARAVRELARTVEELRTELEDSRSRRRPPLVPPSPGELLRFTDDVALPALLAVLEGSVRTLEAFQRGLDLVRADRAVRGRTDEATDRATAVRETTLSQLDEALARLQRAVSEGEVPADDRARDLLEDARSLRDDVDRRLREATDDREVDRPGSGPISIDVEEGTPLDGTDDRSTSNVDVDAELETLKDRYGEDPADAPDDDDRPADDSGTAGSGADDPRADGREDEGGDGDDSEDR